MKCKRITFISDGNLLSGTLHLPETNEPPMIIGSHGLLSGSDSPKQIALANECAAAGMAFFRFDHRGCGNSQGDFENDTSLESRCNDLIHAVEGLKAKGFSCSSIGLFGSSLGGATCIASASALSANALVINAAPVNLDKISSIPEVTETLANNIRFDLTLSLNHLHHALIFHGDMDEIVPVSHGRFIYEHAQHPKRLTIFENGDHAVSNPEHQQTFVRESVRWFRKYLIGTP